MNPNEQRIAIAEFCGWTYQRTEADGGSFGWVNPSGGNLQNAPGCFPHYLNNLNDMHEAEMLLDDPSHGGSLSRFDLYSDILSKRFGRTIRATAAQRAEALLRAIHKWDDGSVPVSPVTENPQEDRFYERAEAMVE